MWVGRRKAAPYAMRGRPRGAGGGTLRVPPPDLLFPEERGSSVARQSGIEGGSACRKGPRAFPQGRTVGFLTREAIE